MVIFLHGRNQNGHPVTKQKLKDKRNGLCSSIKIFYVLTKTYIAQHQE